MTSVTETRRKLDERRRRARDRARERDTAMCRLFLAGADRQVIAYGFKVSTKAVEDALRRGLDRAKAEERKEW